MDFRAPAPVIEALRRAVDHGVFGYESPTPRLRAVVAARMERLYGWQVDPDWVVAVPGLVSGFNAAAHAFCRPGEGYLVQPPVYMPFHDLEANAGLVRQCAPLDAGARGDRLEYHINWDLFRGAFGSGGARTAMFLLCDPHNPVGTAWGEAEQRRMAEAALEAGSVIVSDEIHGELLLGGTRRRPTAALAPEFEARSATLVSPSKTFNIAGLFCGFAIVPDPGLRAAYERSVDRLTLHCSSLSLAAAEAALSGDCEDWLAALLPYLTANRDYLVEFVAERMPGVRITRPDATYLAWLDARELGIADPARFFLEEAQVALNGGAAFGPGGEGRARLNFACPRATLAEALGRMAAALERAAAS